MELELVEQTAPGFETQHGRRVFLALKNGAFHCKLATRTVSMQSCPVVATLFYDDMEREVVTAKTAPLATKATVAGDGKTCTVECRVKVLSSAHEDSNFRVRFRVLDGATGKPFEPDAVVFSEAVRIVSKPEQLTGKATGAGPTEPVSRPQKLRSEYVEQLERIRDVQRDQVGMLRALVAQREKELRDAGRGDEVIAQDEFLPAGYASLAPVAAAPSKKRQPRRKKHSDEEDDDDEEDLKPVRRKKSKKALAEEQRQQQQQQQQQQQPAGRDAFDGAFFRFLASFNDLRPSAKVEQLRRSLQQLPPAKKNLWQNFVTVAIAETKTKVEEATKGPPVDMCACEGCPYRAQVVNFDLLFDAPQMGDLDE